MATRKTAVPDAWDDDWEKVADSQEATVPKSPVPEVSLSRAERKAKHQEANKQLWEAAETNPSPPPIFLQARSSPPLQTSLKPAVKVLSRRPAPKPTTALDGDDSEEEERKRSAAEFAARQVRAAKEREEKQRKYAEVRERLFGAGSAGSGSGNEGKERTGSRPENSSAGAGGSRGLPVRNKVRGKQQNGEVQGSPARGTKDSGGLYDPGYSVKPNSVYVQRREGGESAPSGSGEERPIREPKGPDGSAGFGFTAKPGSLGFGKGAAT